MLLFYSAEMVGHIGPITRIASGCNGTEMGMLLKLHEQKKKQGAWKDAYVHFTPHFAKDSKSGRDYKFYNKPFGMLHWLKHGDHGDRGVNEPMAPSVIALVDPDQLFLRPMSSRVGNASNLLSSHPVSSKILAAEWPRVKEGKPAGQFYGIGDRWLRLNREYICGKNSPCVNVSPAEAWRYYSVGPPYVLHEKDWLKVAASWSEFCPRVYEEHPQLMAEMYAFCLSAAHHKLPHARIDSWMVSNTGSYGEAWQFVDEMPSVCNSGLPLEWTHLSKLPTFLHACQSYRAATFSYGKRSIDHGIFNCPKESSPKVQSVSLQVPPKLVMELSDQAEVTAVSIAIRKKHRKLTELEKKRRDRKRNAFIVCTATKYLNEAVKMHQLEHCDGLMLPAGSRVVQ